MRHSVDFLYSLYDALVSINVPSDKARAVVDAMERDMATRSSIARDLEVLRSDMTRDMESLRLSLIVRLGAMMFVAMGLLFTALKLT